MAPQLGEKGRQDGLPEVALVLHALDPTHGWSGRRGGQWLCYPMNPMTPAMITLVNSGVEILLTGRFSSNGKLRFGGGVLFDLHKTISLQGSFVCGRKNIVQKEIFSDVTIHNTFLHFNKRNL